MNVYIVGSGKLASELLAELEVGNVIAWPDLPAQERSIVVHAGSGRELKAVTEFCRSTGSTLIELSTGSVLESSQPDFPVILCPNINILMLKFMSMVHSSGAMFQGYNITVTESHQAEKSSVPGTAVYIAESLGQTEEDIRSIRDSEAQQAFGIPEQHLARHAVHKIEISDSVCSLSLESQVYGASPYASGVSALIKALDSRLLENRVYAINEFIEKGWL